MKSTVTISAKGQIVIPAEVRRCLGIKPGAKLRLRVADTHFELSPLPEDLIGHLRRVVKKDPSLSQMLLAERESDCVREEEDAERFCVLTLVEAGKRALAEGRTRSNRSRYSSETGSSPWFRISPWRTCGAS